MNDQRICIVAWPRRICKEAIAPHKDIAGQEDLLKVWTNECMLATYSHKDIVQDTKR